ncbi:uncharacterized protein K460DRAFT_106567 [Cucurbitaria berberidis CBS 394.84]|uniref:Uncharacterized protein n=1 Tax=Cucurbitaria berberidis CBS 394.84 TaxID=1168544 RepID=A0A9P4L8I4_9PLEO|nr:uncharacterized protein K460DRAFT_106567 [Cucurbitaria berberidis CBS 394.84]KAF1845303.1 hypothetical protein K460DRAFT_106567 [Cucurbitaria berberidis CBS 394.84]
MKLRSSIALFVSRHMIAVRFRHSQAQCCPVILIPTRRDSLSSTKTLARRQNEAAVRGPWTLMYPLLVVSIPGLSNYQDAQSAARPVTE